MKKNRFSISEINKRDIIRRQDLSESEIFLTIFSSSFNFYYYLCFIMVSSRIWTYLYFSKIIDLICERELIDKFTNVGIHTYICIYIILASNCFTSMITVTQNDSLSICTRRISVSRHIHHTWKS